MAVQTNYYIGGLIPAAPAQNRFEQWDNAAGTYTSWNGDGTVRTTRPLNPVELAWLAKLDQQANGGTIRGNVQAHLAQLEAWLAANPTGAVLTPAQTRFEAQMLAGLARLLLDLTTTVGGAT